MYKLKYAIVLHLSLFYISPSVAAKKLRLPINLLLIQAIWMQWELALMLT